MLAAILSISVLNFFPHCGDCLLMIPMFNCEGFAVADEMLIRCGLGRMSCGCLLLFIGSAAKIILLVTCGWGATLAIGDGRTGGVAALGAGFVAFAQGVGGGALGFGSVIGVLTARG